MNPATATDFVLTIAGPIAPDDARLDNVGELLLRHGVVVIRPFPITDDEFHEFAQRFGTPMGVHEMHREGDLPIRVQSNVDGRGKFDAGLYWHYDGYFDMLPPRATLLSCAAAPDEGGVTHFADARALLDALDPADGERLRGLKGLYRYRRDGRPDGDVLERYVPMVGVHPVAGTSAIRFTERMERIAGIPDQESARIVGRVEAQLANPSFVHTHHWKLHDLVVWDNSSVLHKATPVPDGGGAKITRRITVR